MKTCTKCKLELPVNCFHKQKSSPDGLRSWCKSCRSKYRDPVKESARVAAWYKANRARALSASAARYKRNPERARLQSESWRASNAERYKARNAAYYARTKEDQRAYGTNYRLTHKAEAKRASAAWYQANRERSNQKSAAWNKANPERRLGQDGFIRNMLRTPFAKIQIPQELIKLKRVQLQITRKLKELKK